MFCPQCGTENAENAAQCIRCGRSFRPAQFAAPPPVSPGMAFPPGMPVVPTTSGKAVTSLICGLFAWMFPVAIVAIVFGHLALSEIKKSMGRLKGNGMAIAGLVLGYAGVAFIPLILIIAAIAIPNLLRAKIATNESAAAAAASVRTILAAETVYSGERNVAKGYSCELSELKENGLIDTQLASGKRHGYTFELLDCEPDTAGGPNVKFKVVAYPISRNTTGMKAFCSDETMVIKIATDGSPQTCMERGEVLQ